MPPIYFENESRGVSFKENVDAAVITKPTRFENQVMKPSTSENLLKHGKTGKTIPPIPSRITSTAIIQRDNKVGKFGANVLQRTVLGERRNTAQPQPSTSSTSTATRTRRMVSSTEGRQKIDLPKTTAASNAQTRSKSLERIKSKSGRKNVERGKGAAERPSLIGQRASSVDRERSNRETVVNESYIQHRRRIRNASRKVETFANPLPQPISKAIARKHRANSTPPAAPLHFSPQFRVGTTSSWPPISRPAVITGGFRKLEKDRQQILENQRLLRKLVQISNRKTQFGIAKAASCRTLKFQIAP